MNALDEIMFFVSLRLEDVAEDPTRLKRAEELVRTDIQGVLSKYIQEIQG